MLQAPHKVTKRVKAVSATSRECSTSTAWVTVGARLPSGKWLGVKKFQGPFQGTREVTAKLFQRPKNGRIVVEFGLQLGDACPQVGGGDVEFESVEIKT